MDLKARRSGLEESLRITTLETGSARVWPSMNSPDWEKQGDATSRRKDQRALIREDAQPGSKQYH